jgi:predicted HicB family RNase H-like nuclease
MPNAPKTPLRNVRVNDDLWRDAQAKAADDGVSVSEVIRRALEHYVNGVNCPLGQ